MHGACANRCKLAGLCECKLIVKKESDFMENTKIPMPTLGKEFLPVSPSELKDGVQPDFVYVSGDAYIDHPSFGTAVISRVLQHHGFSVAIIPQPNWKDSKSITVFGKPRLGFLVSAGNIDSMVAHYTASKKHRSDDFYSPGGKAGFRPDRAVIVYCNMIRRMYGDVPVIIGGIEASLRRFAHYDYWDNKVRRSILIDSGADILSYGMGEKSITEIAKLLNKGVPVKKIKNVRGTSVVMDKDEDITFEHVDTFEYDLIKTDKSAYCKAFSIQYKNTDAINGKAVTEFYDNKKVVQNPPFKILSRQELDEVYSLPYTRKVHPMYDSMGGVPALGEVEFSITHNRGCFGGCAFCALSFHQGRTVSSRSIESVVAEAELLASLPGFKGYIHDVGGPTANFRYSACKQVRDGKKGVCPDRRCLAPTPCKNLICDHSEYLTLLRKVSEVKGVKKVFVRSGIRFDYLMYDKSDEFFKELVTKHVSGQMKVAPEHISPKVLSYMGKPGVNVYNAFCDKYFEICKKAGLKQYLVPYLMSSHPGSSIEEAIELALYLKEHNMRPEQVQDFYPTPGTVSTAMYYTGIDPFTMKKVYVATDYNQKLMQRALLQYTKKENRLVITKAVSMSRNPKAKSLLGTNSPYGGNHTAPSQNTHKKSKTPGGIARARAKQKAKRKSK